MKKLAETVFTFLSNKLIMCLLSQTHIKREGGVGGWASGCDRPVNEQYLTWDVGSQEHHYITKPVLKTERDILF
jgi:hypothetical protein